MKAREAFYIYPNPKNGSFEITIGDPGKNLEIEVLNLVGQLVYHVQGILSRKNYYVNMSVVRGIYLVRVMIKK